MAGILGLDTSNYTTSAAVYDTKERRLYGEKKLLPVKEGELGLRQSDAVFHHVRQLPERIKRLREQYEGSLQAVAASDRPRQTQGSYMPCFLAGWGLAEELAEVLRIPLYRFTHQQGHVAAAAFGSGHAELLAGAFLAFHVSGGTTDALLIRPDADEVIVCGEAASSLDLKAGQLIDRGGRLLGLPFPAGPALDRLAGGSAEGDKLPRPSLKGANCSLSGVENQCRALLQKGEEPEKIARFCLLSIAAALEGMAQALQEQYGKLPLVYAGGVMSNTLLRQRLASRFGGWFAPPELSADNACGIALLGAVKEEGLSCLLA